MTPAELRNRPAVAKTLRDAAAVVERGWTQSAYARDGAGNPVDCRELDAVSWCAVGAIASVLSGVGSYAADALRMHIGREFFDSVAHWNDKPDRTAEQVAAAMRACADRVERGEL